MSAAEIVRVQDLNPGDVVSGDEDPERWTVEDVWPDDLPEHRSILWRGAACPVPWPTDHKLIRWERGLPTDGDPEGFWMHPPTEAQP